MIEFQTQSKDTRRFVFCIILNNDCNSRNGLWEQKFEHTSTWHIVSVHLFRFPPIYKGAQFFLVRAISQVVP